MKKLATILALTAVVANLGVSAVFAQVETATGTQDIDCGNETHAFGTELQAPDDFQIGSTGTRAVSSSNDTVYTEGTNSAYFNEADVGAFEDTVDDLTISSNVPYSCGANGRGIGLSVSATAFNNGTNDLMTYGSDGVVGGALTAADYYPVFSVTTSAAPHCTGTCVLAEANNGTEAPTAALEGNTNLFAAAGPHAMASTVDGTGDSDAVLRDSDNTTNTPILYQALYGIEGEVTIPGLDFNLALPSNIEFTGSFSSTVTYTLSTPAL